MVPLKVSILIPTYNRAAFLEEALASALSQTYEPLEVVVSDNASTDGTPDVAKKYAGDTRVRWNRNPQNIGLAPNWDKLLYELATGDYVKILADDDYLTDPEHVTKAMRLVVEHGARAVFAGGKAVEERSGEPVDVSMGLPSVLTPDWWLDHYVARWGEEVLFPNLVSGGLFDRRAAMDLGAFRNPVFGMDYELALQFMLGGTTGYVGGYQYVPRSHPDNDGKMAPLDVVLTSLALFERVRLFGHGLKLPEDRLAALCRRGLRFFVKGFVVPSWLQHKGFGVRSWFDLYRRLAQVDPVMARETALDPVPIVKSLLGRRPSLYRGARRIYKILRGHGK